jgi:PST family polysaccharide transporter
MAKRSKSELTATDDTSVASFDPPIGPSRDTSGRPRRQWYGKLAKRGVAWSFVREAGTEVILTPAGLLLARLLSPSDFGVVASAAFFLTLATRLTNVGFNLAITRIKVLRPEHCSSVFVVSLGMGATAFAILAGSGTLLASFFRAPQLADIMPIAALCFLITPFGTVPAALMSRQMRFRQNAMIDWIGSIASATTAITMAFMGYGYWALVYNQLASDVVSTIAKIIWSRWVPRFQFSVSAIKELFSFGTGIFAKRLLDYSAGNLDNLVVGRSLGMAALGYYDKGFLTVRRILMRLNTGGPMVSFRVLSLIYSEPERFRKAYQKVVLANSLIAFPSMLGLAVLAPDLIPIMYGQRWKPTIIPFQILCISGIFKVLTEYSGSAIQALGMIWGQVARQVVLVAMIVVFVAAFSPWGLPGAAFGVLVANIVMYLLIETHLIKQTAITPFGVFESQLPGLLCGLFVAVSAGVARWLVLTHAPSISQWERLIIQTAAAGVAYAGYMKFNRFSRVRTLMRDTAADLAPPLGPLVRLLA